MEYKLVADLAYTPVVGASITNLAPGTYLVRFAAKEGFNAGATAELIIAAGAAPIPTISPAVQQRIGFVGSTIIATSSYLESNFVGEVSYSRTEIPSGLSFDSSTGVITGSPTSEFVGVVTITATGEISGSAIATVTFVIQAKPIADVSAAIAVTPALNQDNVYAADLPGVFANIPVQITVPAGTTGAVATAFEITASAASSDSYTALTIVAKKLSDSATVTTFLVPIEIKLPASIATDAIPAWSSGGNWASIALIPGGATTLPAGAIDGYYLSGTDRVILTKHLTSFGYRKDQSAVTLTAASTSVTSGATVNLTAGGGSGTIGYTYASSTTSVCTVSASGLVTTIAAGTCSVTATNPSNGDYVSKTSSAVSITVNAPATPAPDPVATLSTQPAVSVVVPADLEVGKTATLTTTGGAGSGSNAFFTNNAAVCTVTGAGVVTAVSAGTCSVFVQRSASGFTTATSANATFKILSVAEAKAIADAAAKAAAEKAAAEKAAAEKAAAEKAALDKAEAEAKAKVAAEAAAAEAARVEAIRKAGLNSIGNIKTVKGKTTISMNLADKFYGYILELQVRTFVKGKARFTTIEYFAVERADGVVTVSTMTKLAKGQLLRVLSDGKVVRTLLR